MLVDSHCHVGHVEGSPETVVAEAMAAGVEAVVDIGMGTEESAEVVARARLVPGLYASVGIHPNDLDEFERDPDASIARLRELASAPGVVGIGETGLDLYRDRSSPELQERAFRAQIALARETGRTLVIHCRDAHARVLEILDEDRPERVVMHCFSGDADHARACADRGFYCSFAGNVTYGKSDALRAAASVVPDELLLVETDAPYLAPHPFRGKPNAPRLLPHTVQAVADVRSVSFEDLAGLTRGNCYRAFGIVA